MPIRSIYLCYFGVREPLVHNQVLPYLRELRAGGVELTLLTFEPEMPSHWPPTEELRWEERLANEGIEWHALPYHKTPTVPATLFDVLAGTRLVSALARRKPFDVYHARGHVGAAIGALAKRSCGGRLIFDIRGFLPEEYVDAGRWPSGGGIYRLVKRAEQGLVKASDGFVVLTERAREIMFSAQIPEVRGKPVEVIPCCVDLNRFPPVTHSLRDEVRTELGLAGRNVIVYVGALGGWYLTEEMVQFLIAAKQRDKSTFAMVLTQSDPNIVVAPLHRGGFTDNDLLVRQAEPASIPRYLAAADLALSLIKPCFSKLSSSPTKLAEYLACGVPVICNAGIGDVDSVVKGANVGVIFTNLTRDGYLAALEAADELRADLTTAERCRQTALAHFDLSRVGGARYRRLYERVSQLSCRSLAEARP